LYSSWASQGVFVSVIEPDRISFPMMRAAAFDGPACCVELAARTVYSLGEIIALLLI